MKIKSEQIIIENGSFSERITIETGKGAVYVTDERVKVYWNGFIVNQFMFEDAKPDERLLPFQVETPRYKPKEKN